MLQTSFSEEAPRQELPHQNNNSTPTLWIRLTQHLPLSPYQLVPVHEAWGAFFAKVARANRGKASLIGYELINEPFAGNIYTNPMLAIPRFADAWRLQPAYDKVAKSIREADPEGLIYFAGVTWADMHDHVEYSGFSHAPGGEEFKVLGLIGKN